MNTSLPQLRWLRRCLATCVGLLAVTLVCGLLWGLLSSMGDTVGAKAFRGATIGFASLGGIGAFVLLIGTAWSVTQLLGSSHERPPTSP